MLFFPVLLTICFSFFSTAVMGYIAMAIPIGPWIAPTIVLAALLLLKLIAYQKQSQALAYIAVGSSIGGILATAAGFSYPTLYFLDPLLFMSWMSQPIYFIVVLSALAGVAGLFGLAAANLFEQPLVIEQQLAFPIGQLVYKMIAAGNQLKKAMQLLTGFISTILFCLFQDGMGVIPAFIPRALVLVRTSTIALFTIPHISFDLWPMLWAIGFVAGHVIAIPLAIGAFLQIGLKNVHTLWFSYVSSTEFTLAFGSGMVLYGAMISFLALPAMLKDGIAWITKNNLTLAPPTVRSKNEMIRTSFWILVLGSGVMFLKYWGFSFLSILFLYLATFACMYQVAVIAGKFGLAPLGRFATFVMVPAMLLFRLNFVQIVIVATFVEIACGVVADVLFGRKMAHLMQLDRRIIFFYQLLGLLVSACAVGFVFWFLINHFQLGSPELVAYRAQSRQLLIHARQFDLYVLALGALCSFLLKYAKVNPMLVFGGILMPLNLTIGLIFGGLITVLCKDRQEWEPFWSGVFAANSIWMLGKAMVG